MNARELKAKSTEELGKILAGERKGITNLRFRSAASEIENPAQIRRSRRQIARILTLLKEKKTEGGINAG